MSQSEIDVELRDDVRLLGNYLGDTLKQHVGQTLYDQVEHIRKYAKGARDGDAQAQQQLEDFLQHLSDEDALPLSRAFTHFLNFANIAEQYHGVRQRRRNQFDLDGDTLNQSNVLQQLFKLTQSENINKNSEKNPT